MASYRRTKEEKMARRAMARQKRKIRWQQAEVYRKSARLRLRGNGFSSAVDTFIYLLMQGVQSALVCFGLFLIVISIVMNFIGGWTPWAILLFTPIGLLLMICALFIFAPFKLGYVGAALDVSRGHPWTVGRTASGWYDGNRPNVLDFINNLFVGLWSCLLIFPGVMYYYYYATSFHVLWDVSSARVGSIRRTTKLLMKGNRMRMFELDLTFLGWYLLSILTAGILLLWVMPYHQTARAQFYRDLIQEKEDKYSYDLLIGGAKK